MFHQAIDPMLAAPLPKITQVMGNLAIAIHAAAFQPGLLDQAAQPLIILLPRRCGVGFPGVIAARMNRHHVAEPTNWVLCFVRQNEGVPYRDSLAKYAAAFFRMSRSSLTRFNSALRRRISADWPCNSFRSTGGRL